MSPRPKENPEDLQEKVLQILDKALEMKLGLSPDDSVYDLVYISEQLSKVSSYQESISDMQMELTKIAVATITALGAATSVFNTEERKLKESEEYQQQPRDQKTNWLQNQLETFRTSHEQWNTLKRVVSEVTEAVGERAQTIKRLDSALRLQTKLLEMKIAAGAAPRPGFSPGGTGNSGELDIN